MYAYDNLYFISVMDFIFAHDVQMEYPQTPFLSFSSYETFSYYETFSELRLSPSQTLHDRSVMGYVGTETLFRSLLRKNIPMRSVSISLTPVYYEHLLKQKYPQDYRYLMERLNRIHGKIELPELSFLLQQIRTYRPSGIAAKLYYESVVVQALSLLMNQSLPEQKHRLTDEDIAALHTVCEYLDVHYRTNAIRVQELAKNACMSPSKLKYAFKQQYNCTISEYVSRKRIQQALELLLNSRLDIAQIAGQVGYKKASSFSAAFRNATGTLPNRYRKQHKGVL